MLKSKKWAFVTGIMLVSLVLSACQGQTIEVPVTVPAVIQTQLVVQTEVVRETQIVETEITATPAPVVVEVEDRSGAWLDTVIIVEEPSADAAISRLEVGDIDLYAFAIAQAPVVQRIAASENIVSDRSFGSYDDLTFNTAEALPSGGFNPFSNAKIREAMNWLIDRSYIAEEIYGGLAVPRFTTFNGASSDYANLADVVRSIESKYAYNLEMAEEVITAEMEAMGASLEGGVWTVDGAPLELIFLIRTEDNRRGIGDYVSNQLEEIGFTVIRDYKTAGEAGPIWLGAGEFHIYTGGWVSVQVPRDLGGNFSAFYTPAGRPDPLWQNYTPNEEFNQLSDDLVNNAFSTLEERREMLSRALELSLEDSARVWVVDRAGESPRAAGTSVAADLYSAVYGSSLWPYTLRREGEIGGSMRVAMPSILTQPWNPLDSSNWVYDSFVFRGTGETGTNPDPYTGLLHPNRIERAEVVVEEGLPVGQTLDWVTLEFESEIAVPADAWADWDPVAQEFIPVGDGVTALSKSTVYYPADLYETVKWHDGSEFSIADIVMFMIITFDRGKEESVYYDASKTAALNQFLAAFKGVKIVSEDPLVIETYSDAYALDAELNVTTWWPYYLGRSQGAWHTIALGLGTETAGVSAFSTAKAALLEVDQLNYIAGPTVALLNEQLTAITASGELPYSATLGQYITADEATARFTNLAEWFRTRGHFWVGTGAFYLERAFPVEGTIILQRNAAYPDDANKWARFSAPAIPVVELDGPTRVTIGSEAVVDVYLTFDDAPYAQADINEVKYLVFDAEGALAASGAAEAVEDGHWQVTLDAETTGALSAGSNRLEVIAVSNRVALPALAEMLFVTAP